MNNILLIAGGKFRETLSMKLVYAVLLVGIGMLLLLLVPMAMFELFVESGEEELAGFFRFYIVHSLFVGFEWVTIALTLLLGSMAVSGEIKHRTILTVLSRPVERWQFITGKWLGIAAFLLIVQTLGMAACALLTVYLEQYPSELVLIRMFESYVTILLYLTLSLALGALLSAAPAFAIALFFLAMVTPLVHETFNSPFALLRMASGVLHYVVPAKMPHDLLEASFAVGIPDPNHLLYLQVLAANAVFGLTVFAVGCALFSRRQIAAGN